LHKNKINQEPKLWIARNKRLKLQKKKLWTKIWNTSYFLKYKKKHTLYSIDVFHFKMSDPEKFQIIKIIMYFQIWKYLSDSIVQNIFFLKYIINYRIQTLFLNLEILSRFYKCKLKKKIDCKKILQSKMYILNKMIFSPNLWVYRGEVRNNFILYICNMLFIWAHSRKPEKNPFVLSTNSILVRLILLTPYQFRHTSNTLT